MKKKYHSENVSSADNQQERSNIENWIVGFTDGEGCFSVSFIKNQTTKSGWQIFPEFVITQGKRSFSALKIYRNFFKCGKIFINKRYDNHRENIYRFCIRSIDELQKKVIPFFANHKLKTAKKKDFELFSRIVKMIYKKKHLSKSGASKIAKMIEKMNSKKKSRFLESSETIR